MMQMLKMGEEHERMVFLNRFLEDEQLDIIENRKETEEEKQFYDESFVQECGENDCIDAIEEGFMMGYIASFH